MRRQFVAVEQPLDPGVLGMRLVAEGTSLEKHDGEAGVFQKLMDLARRVFTVVARLGFSLGGRFDIGVKKSGMIALEDGGEPSQRRDVGRGEHEMSAGLQ